MKTKTASTSSLLSRFGLFSAVAIVFLLICYEALNYPILITKTPVLGIIYLLMLVTILVFYCWYGFRQTSLKSPHLNFIMTQGNLVGVIVGLLWIVELWAGNLTTNNSTLVLLAYYGSILGVMVVTLVGAALTSDITSGIQLGVWSGLVSALIMVLAGLLMQIFLANSINHDARDLQHFVRSGLPDLRTYDVGETLSGMISHLWIGPIVGLVLGCIGGNIGKFFNRSPKPLHSSQ